MWRMERIAQKPLLNPLLPMLMLLTRRQSQRLQLWNLWNLMGKTVTGMVTMMKMMGMMMGERMCIFHVYLVFSLQDIFLHIYGSDDSEADSDEEDSDKEETVKNVCMEFSDKELLQNNGRIITQLIIMQWFYI